MAEWIAYDRVDPWDEARADLRAGIVAATIANVNRSKKTRAFKPEDFMPYTKMERERQRVLSWPKGSALGKKARGILSGIAKTHKKIS